MKVSSYYTKHYIKDKNGEPTINRASKLVIELDKTIELKEIAPKKKLPKLQNN